MNNIEKIDEIAKDKLELAETFDQTAKVASIYGVKAAMVEYEHYIANKLKDRIEDLDANTKLYDLLFQDDVLRIIDEVRDE